MIDWAPTIRGDGAMDREDPSTLRLLIEKPHAAGGVPIASRPDEAADVESLVAVSGGVDSSVAAAVLREKGHKIAAITLALLSDAGDGAFGHHGEELFNGETVSRARDAASTLGVPLYILDAREVFASRVLDPFAREFAAGRTPNPCVWCNEHLKFGLLLRCLDMLGGRHLCTGHYARIIENEKGVYRLFRGRDSSKDQSYFLYRLTQKELARVLFPLGGLEKTQVKEIARKLGLPALGRPESQDACFVDGRGYQAVIEDRLGTVPSPGDIVHLDGRVLGRHHGVHEFTVGQRRGLGIASGEPLYVVGIDSDTRRIMVGSASDLERRLLFLSETSWVEGSAPGGEGLTARVRYRHEGVAARIEDAHGNKATILLEEPVRGAAPGQAAVLYRGDEVVGGGTIEETR